MIVEMTKEEFELLQKLAESPDFTGVSAAEILRCATVRG